jgi:phosphoglycolate phosphatase/putative hydrolase of the HAD superfamily
LALVSNNPRSVVEASLACLDVGSAFELAIGLDDSLRSKPDPASFILALSRLGLGAESCLSIGDRYDVDIAPALGLGMGAILVDGVEDVYRLPDCLQLDP